MEERKKLSTDKPLGWGKKFFARLLEFLRAGSKLFTDISDVIFFANSGHATAEKS